MGVVFVVIYLIFFSNTTNNIIIIYLIEYYVVNLTHLTSPPKPCHTRLGMRVYRSLTWGKDGGKW